MRPLTVFISKSALTFNIQKLKKQIGSSRFCFVVKANAYGHCAKGLVSELNIADYLAVSCVEEACGLMALQVKKPIILLEGVFERDEYKICQENGFEPAITHEYQLDMLEDYFKNNSNNSNNSKINVWLKFDTGMNRLGIQLDAIYAVIARLESLSPLVNQINLMMHFACSDIAEHSLNNQQIVLFNQIDHPSIGYKSICNSAGILNFPDTHHHLVRSGLITYGVSPIEDMTGESLGFKPVMTFQSQIISLKWIKIGESVGYGATFIASVPTLVAIVACGYADGYPREISKDAYVIVMDDNHDQSIEEQRQKAPIIGRISMDMMAIDVTHLSNPKIGSKVILWGAEVPVEMVAKWANTIPYTLLTRIASRVHTHHY